MQTVEPRRGKRAQQPRLARSALLGTGTERVGVRAHGHARAPVCVRAGGRCSHEAAPRRFREAELKHGRVAMLAAWGMITQDIA